MGYDKKNMTLILVMTIVSVLGLSIAFAAFSSTLTINSKANVTPDASSFKVAFSSSSTSLVTNKITPTTTGKATGGAATISGTTISGLSANLTKPGDSVTSTFYAYNAGSYDAYLYNYAKIGNASGSTTFKKCTASSGTTASLVNSACNDIEVLLYVNNMANTGTGGSSGISGNVYLITGGSASSDYRILKGKSHPVIVTIRYKSGSTNLADGVFTVDFGDITLSYQSNNPWYGTW